VDDWDLSDIRGRSGYLGRAALGVAFMRSGRSTEGVDAFQRAVRIEPTNAQYRRNLGSALLQVGRTEEANSYLGE
jgi:Flp pilus assembly protein TadD